jgi:hypothetical protein
VNVSILTILEVKRGCILIISLDAKDANTLLVRCGWRCGGKSGEGGYECG